MQHNHV